MIIGRIMLFCDFVQRHTYFTACHHLFVSSFIKVIGLTDSTNRTIPVEDGSFQYAMRELTPGATYQVQAFTVFDNKESLAYTSRNFTTSKS